MLLLLLLRLRLALLLSLLRLGLLLRVLLLLLLSLRLVLLLSLLRLGLLLRVLLLLFLSLRVLLLRLRLFLLLGFFLWVLTRTNWNRNSQQQNDRCRTDNANCSHLVASVELYSCARHRVCAERSNMPIFSDCMRSAGLYVRYVTFGAA